jgi:hypothetical protein
VLARRSVIKLPHAFTSKKKKKKKKRNEGLRLTSDVFVCQVDKGSIVMASFVST